MIKFIKILPYELKPSGVDLFQYTADLAMRKIDPPSLSPHMLSLDTSIVFHSPLRRAVECLEINKETTYIPLRSLSEISFDVTQFCSEEEWTTMGSLIIRRKFKEFFVEDRLPQKREILTQEIKEVLKLLLKSSNRDISVVSHSFRLKIIQAFIETSGKLSVEPNLIQKFILDDTKTYNFGSGFSVQFEDIEKSLL